MISFKHKGYLGIIDGFDEERELMSGTVPGMRDVLHFEGSSIKEARVSFETVVNDYLLWCERDGVEPQKPKSGRILLRVEPDLHRQIEEAAAVEGRSMNDWIVERLRPKARDVAA